MSGEGPLMHKANMMRLRKINFDPPPPPPGLPAYYDNYDIREFNHSVSSINSDKAFINVNDNNENDKEEEDEQGDQDAVSITWSNAPGIDDSYKSDSTEYVEENDMEELELNNSNDSDGNNVKETKRNNNDTDTTVYDDEDENSVFLSWPELPELPLNSPQHEQSQQQRQLGERGGDDESVSSERPPWFNWRRRATDSDVILNTSPRENGDTINSNNGENNNNNNNNNDATDGKKSDDDCLVPANQQWWQFGRRRNTFDSYAAGGRKSSAVESNVKSSGRWEDMESFINGEDMKRRSSGGTSNLNEVSNDVMIDNSNNNSPEKSPDIKSTQMPLQRKSSNEINNSSFTSSNDEDTRPRLARVLSRKSSNESNNSSFTSSNDEDARPRLARVLSRRKNSEINSSFTSSVDGSTKETKSVKKPMNRRKSIEATASVDDEVNDWLFPRRGRRASITQGASTRNLWGVEQPVAASNPPQSQDEDGVEVIVDKLKKSSVDLSPIDRMLLNDMVSSKNTNRWRNRPSMSGSEHNGMMQLGVSTLSMQPSEDELGQVSPEEANRSPQAGSPSRELNDSFGSYQNGVPEIYWDSDKIYKMKGEGVSLARAKVCDEVSSIASSDHSGRITKRKNPSQRRLSFTSSFFGWNSTINENDEDVDDDASFRPEKIVPFKPEKISPRATAGKLSSMKSSIRPKSLALSTPPSLRSKARRRASIDYDDYDDDEMYSVKNPLAEQDLKHQAVVKEANEIMNSVNNSVLAMGMNAPFRPIDEICPPFQKLHKNLGYQMDALNAAIVRTTKSPISKRQGLKKSKSKKLKASNFKSSQFSMSSGNSFMDSSNQSSTMSNILNDSEAMSKFILSQMALLQSQQQTGDSSVNSNVTPRSFYTSWLPNYMWYKTIAADASSVMRPTSLCSGTGITGDEQYLNPEMLKVFEMFSTYFVGSKHLFQEADEDDDDNGAQMRRSYWMDTIEEIDSAEESSEKSTSSDSEASDESDMVYELGEVGSADIDQFVDTEKQIEILQTVINDLRKSRVNDRPFVSIEASAPGPGSNLSSSTSTNDGKAPGTESNLSSSLSNDASGRESNLTSSTLTNDI